MRARTERIRDRFSTESPRRAIENFGGKVSDVGDVDVDMLINGEVTWQTRSLDRYQVDTGFPVGIDDSLQRAEYPSLRYFANVIEFQDTPGFRNYTITSTDQSGSISVTPAPDIPLGRYENQLDFKIAVYHWTQLGVPFPLVRHMNSPDSPRPLLTHEWSSHDTWEVR